MRQEKYKMGYSQCNGEYIVESEGPGLEVSLTGT